MDKIQEFLNSPLSLITAIGGLFAGITALIKSIREFKSVLSKNKKNMDRKPKSSSLLELFRSPTFFVGLIVTIVSVGLFVAKSMIPVPSQSEALITQAWSAYNSQKYELAISKSVECIDLFEGQALRTQTELENNKVVIKPPERCDSSDIARGTLNDVATSYFIMGQSYEKLGNVTKAKEAYTKAQNFTYAMAWDSGGWCWSPSNASADRLSKIP